LRHVGFESPLFKLAIMQTQATVKIARQPGDHVFVADIGITQSAGAESAQVPTGFDQYDGFALALGGNGCHYARRGGAVYADIDFAGGLCGAGEYQAAEAKTEKEETGMHLWWCFFEFSVVVKIGKFGGLCKGGF